MVELSLKGGGISTPGCGSFENEGTIHLV
jgi:hypothetical protein